MVSTTKTAFGATADADFDHGYLNEPLRRLAWYRRELDGWDADAGARALPQPVDFGLDLPDLKPSEIRWRAAS